MAKLKRSLSSTRLIRSFNVASVLHTLYRKGGCTRTDIAQATGMSAATVTRIVSEMVEQGLVVESAAAGATAGRRPFILKLNSDQIYAVGIQVVRDRLALGLCNLRGEILAKATFQPYALEPDSLIAELSRELERLLAANGMSRDHILGIGLAISGIVDTDTGTLLRSVNLGWRDVPISQALEKAFGASVVVENDANAAALAEMWFGCAKDTPNFMYLKTDTGVGAGIVSHGELLRGPRGMAGEIGHVPVGKNGRECVCGQQGCLETYLYARGLFRRYAAETGTQLERTEDFFDRARAGDRVARAMVEEAVQPLSVVASFGATLLDLDLLVLGGLWGQLGDAFCRSVEDRCAEILERSGLRKSYRVRGSALAEDSDIRGAVGIVLNKLFTPPIRGAD